MFRHLVQVDVKVSILGHFLLAFFSAAMVDEVLERLSYGVVSDLPCWGIVHLRDLPEKKGFPTDQAN
jgi:hypothetical protein